MKELLKNLQNNLIPCNSGSKSWNILIDKSITPLRDDTIASFATHRIINYPEKEFWSWLWQSGLEEFKNNEFPHKKALEFFFSSKLLNIGRDDHVLDAAGGRSGYLNAIRNIYGCRNIYLSDHIYRGVKKDPDGITIIGGDISKINFPDSSIDKIACHHAFEHFQHDSDIGFITEIGRLLKPGGKACIIPLFLVDKYTECWNIERTDVFDKKAVLIIDKSASIPGADEDGHFARFYDRTAFNERVVSTARNSRLNSSVVTCIMDGKDLPDMDKNFGSKLNYPLRALVLDKLS